ncbi:MAG: hypothetical protein ABW125_15135 [Candidatus Thiodiazotropha lotti]
MASKDDDFDKENFEALKGNREESFVDAQKRKKEEERTKNLLERDPKAMAASRDDIDLLGDGITYLDPEYDERFKVEFFDKSHAKADYDHWGKVPLWSSADAAALLFGKDPQIVTPDSIQPYIQSSGFPKKYMQMYTLIDRAVSAGELRSNSNLINPTDLLEWARQNQLNIPNELIFLFEEDSKNIETEILMANGEKNQENVLSKSEYWTELQLKTITAVEEFPAWADKTITFNVDKVKDWLDQEPVKANTREAEIIKTVLVDIYPKYF